MAAELPRLDLEDIDLMSADGKTTRGSPDYPRPSVHPSQTPTATSTGEAQRQLESDPPSDAPEDAELGGDGPVAFRRGETAAAPEDGEAATTGEQR